MQKQQTIDKDGNSFYRSWTNKVGDNISNARVDFPLPLKPVITVSLLRGISTSISFKLCTLAPVTIIFLFILCFRKN